MLYEDRHDAGRRLAVELERYRDSDTIVLGLPRGGVVVAYEVALALRVPLDVVVARKLGAPDHPEFGFGAVGPGGVRVLDERAIEMLGLSPQQAQQIVARELAEMERRLRHYRGDMAPLEVRGRAVIIVDDGLATGVSARAALAAIRAHHPRTLVLAVPVASPVAAETLSTEVDELVCPHTPEDFYAVGQWYDRFEQTGDEEVVALLTQAGASLWNKE